MCPALGFSVPESYRQTGMSPATVMIGVGEHRTEEAALGAGFAQSKEQRAQVGSDSQFQLHKKRLQRRQSQAPLGVT